ncbi:hypothetical protein PR003_g24216 [Phytophthora rubi]|uniref:Uncharacterized protein n=1 Tax=Phytophthora rubi TaxID=129364 RepID=A0A6A4CYL1_9STRA|nr:hypothetical protein PR003_g24216 [Phytophthora rubi]
MSERGWTHDAAAANGWLVAMLTAGHWIPESGNPTAS